MSERFTEQFATDDFDQEMLDYITLNFDYEESEWSAKNACLLYGTGVQCFWTDSSFSELDFKPLTKREFKLKIGMPVETQETYTPEELTYISELEDRIDYLEALCGDYAKIVGEKDAEILRLNNALSNVYGDYR